MLCTPHFKIRSDALGSIHKFVLCDWKEQEPHMFILVGLPLYIAESNQPRK